jgi:Tfp pilus assembly protein PilO
MPNNPDNSAPGSGLKRDLYEHRRWVHGGLIALLVIDALFFFFSYRPLGLSASQQLESLKALRDEAKGKREAVARLKKIEATLGESSRLGDQFYESRFLPAETGFGTIMEELEKLSVATGVHKGSVSYGVQDIKNRPDLEGVAIDTTVEGEYSKIVRFVNQLEQSHLFLIVDSLGISGGGKVKGVSVTVKLLTLFRVPKGMPVPVDAGKTVADAGNAPAPSRRSTPPDSPAKAGN